MARRPPSLKFRIDRLYNGRGETSRRFRYGLLAFDVLTIAYFMALSLIVAPNWVLAIDIVLGAVILADFLARLWISRDRRDYFLSLSTWADIVVIATLAMSPFLESYLFLRVLRTLRLLRSYPVLRDLRHEFSFFRRNEEIIQSVANLAIFIFVVTALVYVLQVRTNPGITNYIDALYFTVTTLTTTGFGDITLQGSGGRLLSVLIMVMGVALFLRLVQTIFRPSRVKYRCPDCGLLYHDSDAVHCKHCGRVLNIESSGDS
ncbi:MAG: ion channel [Pseudomonadota bacterium]|nr:ion channel [Pseudomonadota bacterium]